MGLFGGGGGGDADESSWGLLVSVVPDDASVESPSVSVVAVVAPFEGVDKRAEGVSSSALIIE